MKVPLVYTTVALKNWQAFKKLGITGVNSPGMYHTGLRMELPAPIGDYHSAPSGPDDPVLVRMTRTPCKPGLPSREQHRAGHADLYSTPFADVRAEYPRSVRPRARFRRFRSGA